MFTHIGQLLLSILSFKLLHWNTILLEIRSTQTVPVGDRGCNSASHDLYKPLVYEGVNTEVDTYQNYKDDESRFICWCFVGLKTVKSQLVLIYKSLFYTNMLAPIILPKS